MSLFSSLIYLTFLLIQLTQAMPIHNIANDTIVTTTSTTTKPIIESLLTTKRKNKYTSVVLTSNIGKQLITGDSIQIECPLPRSTQNKLNQETKGNKLKSAPVYITTWFKDQVKVHQFIGEYLDRVTFTGRRLKITDLNKADTGVYSCEIIMGTGQIVHSANLTLQIDEIESNNNEIDTSISNQVDEYQSDSEEQEIIDYDRSVDRPMFADIKKESFIDYNKDMTNSRNNVHYSIFNVPSLKTQSPSQLNFKSEKNDQMFSTPVVVIIAVASVSTVLILFLYCFYKNI